MAKLVAVTAYLIGLAGASVFFAYVLAVGVGLWPRDLHADAWWAVPINSGLLLAFGLQHSGMARRAFKDVWTRLVPAYLERSIYVGTAGITIGALTALWQPLPGPPIWEGPLWIVAISVLAAVFLMNCCGRFNHFAFFGLTQAWTRNADAPMPLCTDGLYRFVRHPLMLGVLVALWAQPIMPPELLMLNAGMTTYILVAIPLEERELLREYGETYEKYRREVPMLIPWK